MNTAIKNSIFAGLALISFIPLYVANSMFFPFITGKAFAFRIIVEIVAVLWLILLFREKGSNVESEKSVIPRVNWITVSVTAFVFIALIADIFGLNFLRSFWSNFERMEGWITLFHLWLYFIVLTSVLKTKENWHKFFNVVIIGGVITALYGLFQFFDWAATHQGSRIDASLGNSAYMAVYMITNAFIALYLAISSFELKNKTMFWLYSLSGVLFSFIMFQTATRGSILGWLFAVLVSSSIYSLWGKVKKVRIISISSILFILLVSVLFYYNRDAKWIQNNEVLGRLATISISDTKTQARGFVWPMAIKGVFENPKTAIIGVGQENFNYIFNSNYNPKMYRHEQWFDRAHNVFLDWLVAGGILGLITYLSLYIISLFYLYKSSLSIGQKSALVGFLVGYGIHNIFVFDNQTSYIMFFGFLAFVHFLDNKHDLFKFKFNHKINDDFITIRDYVINPIVIIAFVLSLYFVNIKPIQANKNLIKSLIACSDPKTVTIENVQKALSYKLTMSSQETREQFLTCATNVINNPQVDQNKKLQFYELAKKEIDNQIKDTPKDARIYIIAGSFFNTIRDFNTAIPFIEKARELSPNKQSIIYELASAYINVGKNKEALDAIEEAYLWADDNYNAKVAYVSTLIFTGDVNKVKEILAKDPNIINDPKVVSSYVLSKQYSKAISIYKDLIKNNPDNQELYSSLVYVYILNKQNSLAVETLKTFGQRFPLLKSQSDEFIKQIESGKVKLQ